MARLARQVFIDSLVLATPMTAMGTFRACRNVQPESEPAPKPSRLSAHARVRPAEFLFHRAPRPDGLIGGVKFDIVPAHHRAVGDIVLQLEAMRQPDRQRARLEAR